MNELEHRLRALRKAYPLIDEAEYHNVTYPYAESTPLHVKRILSELEFVLKLLPQQPELGEADAVRAADLLLAALRDEGTIPKSAAAAAEEALMPYAEAAKAYTVHLVAHAHIDMNWLWAWHETVAVTLETFRTMLKLMDEYPDFRFSQSQASCYRIVEEFEPEMLEEIRRRVHEGRWEVSASTWVEADRNMPNLESVANHLLYTKKYLSGLLEIDPATLNLDFEPDTFGHNVNTPEMLSQGGVKYYYHCRGYAGEEIYNWEAPSGARILVYRDATWYISDANPSFFLRVPEFCGRHGLKDYLRVYGVGDHGGGPTRRDLNTFREMMSWPVWPTLKFSTYAAYYAILERVRDSFPTVKQELNTVFSGCYTTQARIKMANRLGEATVTEAQALTAVSQALTGRAARKKALDEAWIKVLFNQFHDILPGSGVRDTREFAMTRFSEAIGLAGTEAAAALRALAQRIDTSALRAPLDPWNVSEGGGVGYTSSFFAVPVSERGASVCRIHHVFNPTGTERTEEVKLTLWDWTGNVRTMRVTDGAGNALPFELLTPNPRPHTLLHTFRELLVTLTVPALGWTTVVIDDDAEKILELPRSGDPRLEPVESYVLENEYLRAEFDPRDGSLASLLRKSDGRELLAGKGGFVYAEEQPEGMEAWRVGRCVRRELVSGVKLSPVRRGGLRQSFTMSFSFGAASRAECAVSLDKSAGALRLDTTCDFLESGSTETVMPQLSFALPFAYESERTLYDVPAGAIRREPKRQDQVAQSFAAPLPGDGSAPLMLSADSKYGFRTWDGEVQVTLLRAAPLPDPYPDHGKQHFVLAVHAAESACPAKLIRASASTHRPLYSLCGSVHEGDLPLSDSFASLSGEGLVLSSVKPAVTTEGYTVRVYDAGGKGAEAVLTLRQPPRSAEICDLLERPAETIAVENGTLRFRVPPCCVRTLLLRF